MLQRAISAENLDQARQALDQISIQANLLHIAAHSKHESIRKNAVKKVTDERELARLSIESVDEAVRRTAIRLISDETLLKRVATSAADRRVRNMAIYRINDQQVLAEIARTNAVTQADRRVIRAAIQKLEGDTILTELVMTKNAFPAQRLALDRIGNEGYLAWIAAKHRDPRIRALALTGVSDQSFLSDIAIADKDPLVRTSAIQQLRDVPALKAIASANHDQTLRITAIEQIDDQSFLTQLFHETTESTVRNAIVKRLTSQEVLEEIALNDDHSSIRGHAIEKVDDQAVLSRAALNDDWPHNRRKALARIHDADLLATLALEGDEIIRRNAAKRLPLGPDVDIAALSAKALYSRVAFIESVSNRHLLYIWARHSFFPTLRSSAARRIGDDSLLLSTLDVENSPKVRAEIIDSIQERDALEQVAKSAFHSEDRIHARAVVKAKWGEVSAKVLTAEKALELQLDSIAPITDDEELVRLAIDGRFDRTQTEAARAIESNSHLLRTALLSENPDVLRIILRKVEDPGVLERISHDATHPAARLAARIKAGLMSWEDALLAANQPHAVRGELRNLMTAMLVYPANPLDFYKMTRRIAASSIRLGDESRIPILIEMLDSHGDKTLATDYLNSGQPDLKRAAAQWGERRGLQVSYGPSTSSHATWGR
jgi:hypothetical protein